MLRQLALLTQIIPSVLQQIDDGEDAQLNGEKYVERAKAFSRNQLVDMHSDENADEAKDGCTCAQYPMKPVPEGANATPTAKVQQHQFQDGVSTKTTSTYRVQTIHQRKACNRSKLTK